jgi:hypothetical protein
LNDYWLEEVLDSMLMTLFFTPRRTTSGKGKLLGNTKKEAIARKRG